MVRKPRGMQHVRMRIMASRIVMSNTSWWFRDSMNDAPLLELTPDLTRKVSGYTWLKTPQGEDKLFGVVLKQIFSECNVPINKLMGLVVNKLNQEKGGTGYFHHVATDTKIDAAPDDNHTAIRLTLDDRVVANITNISDEASTLKVHTQLKGSGIVDAINAFLPTMCL